MNETVTVLLTLVREPRAPQPEETVSVAECLQALRERLPSPPAGPALRWHSQGRAVVHAPRAVVEAIAGNLIRNAQEHSVGSRIDVRLENDRLVVEDDGVGFGAQAARPGRGLGLSLVKRICERFNWVLQIDSRPGEGTRVEWRFGAA
jgi:signal transduction histidine kinase